jgi:hypothetical protein
VPSSVDQLRAVQQVDIVYEGALAISIEPMKFVAKAAHEAR